MAGDRARERRRPQCANVKGVYSAGAKEWPAAHLRSSPRQRRPNCESALDSRFRGNERRMCARHRLSDSNSPSFRGGPARGRTRNPYAAVEVCGTALIRFLMLRSMDSGFARSRSRPGMTIGRASSPVLFGRPRAGPRCELQFPAPIEGSGAPAGAGACEAPGGRSAKHARGTSCERPVPPLRSGGTRLPALHGGVLRCAGRAFENVDQPRLSASSWRRVLLPGSGAPPSPESLKCVAPNPRRRISRWRDFPGHRPGGVRPHLRPCPHRRSVFTASHDDAPRRAGRQDYRRTT